MAAFQSAVEVGAHALETDIHLSKDGKVVLSHVSSHKTSSGTLHRFDSPLPAHTPDILFRPQDGDLKRCFGQEKAILACDWSYLSTLRTLKVPHEPMPRLRDLLEYLASPQREDIWLLLDIKVRFFL